MFPEVRKKEIVKTKPKPRKASGVKKTGKLRRKVKCQNLHSGKSHQNYTSFVGNFATYTHQHRNNGRISILYLLHVNMTNFFFQTHHSLLLSCRENGNMTL